MKIAVLGAGAMGSLIGAFLKKSGENVLLIDPYREHMEKIRDRGLELHLNGAAEYIRMDTTTSPEGCTPVDVLIVLVKGMYTENALKQAGNLVDAHTYVLTLQNGLGNDDIIAKTVDEDHVLKGVMKIASQMNGPACITSQTMENIPALYIGCRTASDKAAEIAQALAAAFVRVNVLALYKPDIDDYIWAKAVNNISVNTTCAIARLNIAHFLDSEYGKDILVNCVKEVVAVANAKGVKLSTDAVLDTIYNNTVPKIGMHLPSTAQDMKAHKATEVDYLNGAIVRYGEELGIPVPVNRMIFDFAKVIEHNYDNQF